MRKVRVRNSVKAFLFVVWAWSATLASRTFFCLCDLNSWLLGGLLARRSPTAQSCFTIVTGFYSYLALLNEGEHHTHDAPADCIPCQKPQGTLLDSQATYSFQILLQLFASLAFPDL